MSERGLLGAVAGIAALAEIRLAYASGIPEAALPPTQSRLQPLVRGLAGQSPRRRVISCLWRYGQRWAVPVLPPVSPRSTSASCTEGCTLGSVSRAVVGLWVVFWGFI